MVHAIPVAAALRRAWPGARIDWLVSAKHREILDLVTVVDRVIAVRDRRGATEGTPILKAIGELRRSHYDVALDLQGLVKSAMFARASGARRVIGFGEGYVREPLARRFYTETHHPGGQHTFDRQSAHHVIDLNLGVLQTLEIPAGAVEFPIAEVTSAVAVRVLEETRGHYAVLNPGAAWPNKRWPPSRLAALAVALRQQHGLRSVVIWGPGEQALAEQTAAESAGAAIVSPPTTIPDLVALARRARLVVSGDTGPTHIAAAVGAPIVGIYGPTRPERNGPWNPDDVTVSRAATCECHHLRRCRRETMCLLEIGVDEVVAAATRRLASAESGRG
ncbi:MAG: glycosyltransferase family 9 protein [Vicinamibacterales bacterium]